MCSEGWQPLPKDCPWLNRWGRQQGWAGGHWGLPKGLVGSPLCKKHGLGTTLPQEPHTGLVSGLCSPQQDPDVSRRKGVIVEEGFPMVLQVLPLVLLAIQLPGAFGQFEQD